MISALASLDDLLHDRHGHVVLRGLLEFGAPAARRDLMEAVHERDVATLCVGRYRYVRMSRAAKRPTAARPSSGDDDDADGHPLMCLTSPQAAA